MFLALARLVTAPQDGGHIVLQLPAVQLGRWLDDVWSVQVSDARQPQSSNPFAGMSRTLELSALPNDGGTPPLILPSGLDPASPGRWGERRGTTSRPHAPSQVVIAWHHIIYAYLIESTGVFDILAEVARRLLAGESLGVLSAESLAWLRNTEALFFRVPPPYSITALTSELRPHDRVSRRNAYWRMFGMDLPHPIPAPWPGAGSPEVWKADTGNGVNTDFREKWTELLRQVWIGIQNQANTTGANPADPDYIALLCRALQDMLNNRRMNGRLAREEFAYVTEMSWFHLTVNSNVGGANPDSPIVRDLQAQATSPEQRLLKIAQRVGMRPAARSRELFQLAEVTALLLRAIELGYFSEAAAAQALYDENVGGGLVARDMRTIINLWQSATGERIKDRAVGTGVGTAHQPVRAPTPTLVGANGAGRK